MSTRATRGLYALAAVAVVAVLGAGTTVASERPDATAGAESAAYAAVATGDRAWAERPAPAGETLITMPEEGSPFVAFNIWVKAGSQNDPAGKEGLASLTAALLADGSTESHSYQEILEALYPMAAGYGGSVDKEMTVFRGVIHEDNLEPYYEIFSNALLEPAFSEDDFTRVYAQLTTAPGDTVTLKVAPHNGRVGQLTD